MKTLFILLKTLLIAALLTILTQVGGIIYLLFQPIAYWIRKKFEHHKWRQKLIRYAGFLLFYLFFILLIIPPLAKKGGRIPLPWFASKQQPIKAHNILISSLLMRNYVRPELKQLILDTANKLGAKESNFQINYLDANFPFWNEFPLLPHLSHDDGRKLDVSFVYKSQGSGKMARRANGFLGYGVCVKPQKGESNMPAICAEKGEWQYNFMEELLPDYSSSDVQFDPQMSKALLLELAKDKRVGKIFIEKHLEERLGLTGYSKIRQAGCHSVRHDDHIHIQL